MTTEEAFNIAVEAVEKRLAETVKRWGYKTERKETRNWLYWQIVERDPYEFVGATESKPYILLWRPPDLVCQIYPSCASPEELEHAVKIFVSRALEKVALILAHRELRSVRGVDDTWIGSSISALQVYINSEVFRLKFGLGKQFWKWKVVSDEGATLAVIRRPLRDNPIKELLKAARYFSLLLL
jgi:hypothetical protein